MNILCQECMFLRYNMDYITGEKEPYCNLQEDVINQEEFEEKAPKWCPTRNQLATGIS